LDVIGRVATLAGDPIEEEADLAKPVEIQEMLWRWWGFVLGKRAVVCAAHGDGGMVTVREPDDEIRIEPPAELDDLDPVSAKRVMRMGDGDESRKGLG